MVCEHEYMNISPPIIELATALDAASEIIKVQKI